MTHLEARGVVKAYGRTPALGGVTLDVAEGEIVAVTGPSGCGKSTLLHCLAGILRPDAGEVAWRGARIDTWSEAARSRLRRTEFGVLFQFGQLEGIVARRRAYAALVATGVPRGTIGRSIAWQAFAPAVPAVGVALAVGLFLSRGVAGRPARGGGSMVEICDAGERLCGDPATRAQYVRIEWVPEVTVFPDVPLEQLAWIGAGALGAVLVTVGVGLVFLRSGTAVEELRTT